jgi:hypothetical protein
VIAFSENPAKNDVLGNMLASCQNCNLKKLDRPLIDCVQIFAHDLDTKAAGASHLNTEARTCLLVALQLKHELFHNMVIWVSSFQGRDTKLDIVPRGPSITEHTTYLAKNQHTQRKLWNFVN